MLQQCFLEDIGFDADFGESPVSPDLDKFIFEVDKAISDLEYLVQEARMVRDNFEMKKIDQLEGTMIPYFNGYGGVQVGQLRGFDLNFDALRDQVQGL